MGQNGHLERHGMQRDVFASGKFRNASKWVFCPTKGSVSLLFGGVAYFDRCEGIALQHAPTQRANKHCQMAQKRPEMLYINSNHKYPAAHMLLRAENSLANPLSNAVFWLFELNMVPVPFL
jgi:hypothetical protein